MKLIKNIIRVLFSNIATIISGVCVSILLPKIISKLDYGFYKIFTLYFNYLGILSLGIIDGIVLKYGDKNYDELEKEKFRTIFSWYFLINLFFSIVIALISFFFDSKDYIFVILILAANLLPVNILGYFQQISQITQRFKEYSLLKVLQSLANIVLIVSLLVIFYFDLVVVNYQMYLIGLSIINLLLALWYVLKYKDLIFGKSLKFKDYVNQIIELVKIGFPLLFANLCTTFILSLDRQFVSVLYETEEYAVYAFAYSMLQLITVATSAVASVIYPLFKRLDVEKLKSIYSNVNTVLLIFIFMALLVYAPLCYFITWFLPGYTDSLSYFRIILPGIAISSPITVIMHNYYKTLGLSFEYFIKSLVALAISFIFNLVAYLVFKTMASISIASIVTLVIWYALVEIKIRKYCNVDIKNIIYISLMSILFYLTSIFSEYWICLVLYLLSFIVITLVLFYKKKDELIEMIKNK